MESAPNLERLLAELKARVEKRRQEGEYPPELEDDLAKHFRHIVAHRIASPSRVDRKLLVKLSEAANFSRQRIEVNSQVPGGRQVHRMVRKLVARQIDGIFAQLAEFTQVLRQVLDQMAISLEEIVAFTRRDLGSRIELALDHIAKIEERLQAMESNQPIGPSISYKRFEEEFRGSHEELLEKYSSLAAIFEGPVLDIGCRTGALLELLRQREIEAEGIDADPEMVEAAVSLGLRASAGNFDEKLRDVEDGSLGGIAALQIIERLQPRQLVDLVTLASEKLRPGGKLVVEAINPQSLYAHANTLFLDPMHLRPVHPAYLEFLSKQVGFLKTELHWRPILDKQPELHEFDAANIGDPDKLEQVYNLVFGPQGYVLVATR